MASLRRLAGAVVARFFCAFKGAQEQRAVLATVRLRVERVCQPRT
jgi:hypothetical protein